MDKPPAAASAPAASPAGAAPVNSPATLPPLEDWRPEHVKQWRLSLPEDDRINFKEFFDKVIAISAKGSTLASYNEEAVVRLLGPVYGPVFGPELYARLQKLKRQAAPDAVPASAGESSLDFKARLDALQDVVHAEQKATREALMKFMQSQAEDVAFSKVTQTKWEEILNHTGHSVRHVEQPVAPALNAPVPVKPYEWFADVSEPKHENDDDQEPKRWVGYRNWLLEKLPIPEGYTLVSTAQNQRLLKLPDYGCRFTAHGTTDLVLVREAAADSGLLSAATFLLFEIKKPSSGPTPSSWDIQACCELLSVSMNQYRPMVVLTDLNYVWRIFWLEGKVINKRNATFLETAALVQALTRQYAPLEARVKAERGEDDGRIEGTIIHREPKRSKQDGDVALLSDICTPTESEEAFVLRAMQVFMAAHTDLLESERQSRIRHPSMYV